MKFIITGWGLNLFACLFNVVVCVYRVASGSWTLINWANFACVFINLGVVVWYCGLIAKRMKLGN